MVKPYKIDEIKWRTFPPRIQLGNIAAELSRATAGLRDGNVLLTEESYRNALVCLGASLTDPQWQDRKFLYELRDAVAALSVSNVEPEACRFVLNRTLERMMEL